MSKDRKYIAKGTPRSRHIVEVENTKCNKRVLTYSSKGVAESGFRNNGFYNQNNIELEAVECEMTIKIK